MAGGLMYVYECTECGHVVGEEEEYIEPVPKTAHEEVI
ncbi:unnamed protein product, partial [marine sediment metagenome]